MSNLATMKEEGYKFIRWDIKGTALFENKNGNYEFFTANKNHASWGFSWRGTDWEFCSSLTGD